MQADLSLCWPYMLSHDAECFYVLNVWNTCRSISKFNGGNYYKCGRIICIHSLFAKFKPPYVLIGELMRITKFNQNIISKKKKMWAPFRITQNTSYGSMQIGEKLHINCPNYSWPHDKLSMKLIE